MRTKEAPENRSKKRAVGCRFCRTMVKDGIAIQGDCEQDMDVAEILARSVAELRLKPH